MNERTLCWDVYIGVLVSINTMAVWLYESKKKMMTMRMRMKCQDLFLYTCLCLSLSVCAWPPLCVFSADIYVYLYLSVSISVCLCIYPFLYVNIYIHIYIHTCICIYIYKHALIWPYVIYLHPYTEDYHSPPIFILVYVVVLQHGSVCVCTDIFYIYICHPCISKSVGKACTRVYIYT